MTLMVLAGCQTGRSVGAAAGVSGAATAKVADIRSSNGLPPLTADGNLEQAAKQQARYMASAERMVHTTGWRKDFASRMAANDVGGTAAENIAQGRMGIDRLFAMWMASPPHRRNMLDPRMTKFGLASAPGGKNGQRYWALVLSK